jgi:tol-pal system-associated acyl-CoA thioesterase
MSDFWLPIRVYLEDTDAQGVVYNASYFRFMERARTDWLRERGVDHRAFDESLGLQLVLTSIEARFMKPAKLGDTLVVGARLEELQGARAVFAQAVRRESSDGELLSEGRAEVACIERAGGRPRRWPSDFIESLKQ